MHFIVHVNLGDDETLAYAPDAAAMQVLTALGGNPTKDYCVVQINHPLPPAPPSEQGEAGTPPPAQAV
jgi:hypothetical protein